MSARRITLVGLIVATTVLGSVLGFAGATAGGAAPLAGSTTVVASHGASATASGSAASPAGSPRQALEQRIQTDTKTDHIPLAALSLPELEGHSTIANGVVQPLQPVSPAPTGIGTWGVRNTTGTPSAYSIRTSSWEGSITLGSVDSFWLDNTGALNTNGTNNTFGVQLNTVLNDTTVGGTSNFVFWTQNVFYYDLFPGYITFLDNVWNFSSPAESLAPGTIYSGNGTLVPYVFYYDFGPSIPVSLPVTVHLYLNSSTTDLAGIGYSTVRFGFDVVNATTHASIASGVYDTVLFSSALPYASVPASPFLVDGSTVTPTGYLLYDAEIMIGGPGGGTTTSFYGISGSENLQYWNSVLGRYANAPSAWNVGADTGESSEGIAETYTTPGTVFLGAGPSLVVPLWNSTPGGNRGQATFSGPLYPSNAFIFFTPGTQLNAIIAAWAPTQTADRFHYVLPPGTYTIDAMLSDFAPVQRTVTAGPGAHVTLRFYLQRDSSYGVYTPLDAWNNAQLAVLSSGGTGSASNPYLLVNNAPPGGVNPVFGEFNAFFYPVFPGVLLADTTAHVDLVSPSLFAVTYPTVGYYAARLVGFGVPRTNNLQFQIYDASNVTIWGARGITGWFFYQDYGPTGFLPLANVVFWNGQHDLVGDNTFVSQGSSLVLADSNPALPSGNVVWGNTFVNSSVITPTTYPGNGVQNGPPIGISALEAGDLIYNNYVATSITAFSTDANMMTGAYQLNLENWNLSMVEPRYHSVSFNGFTLSGTIVPSQWQGGNYWDDYVPEVTTLPYDEYGFIESGGDYFPLPITAFEVVFTLHEHALGVVWSVTLNGVSQTTGSHTLVFFETPGAYTWSASVVHGQGTISPSSGTISVVSSNVYVSLSLV